MAKLAVCVEKTSRDTNASTANEPIETDEVRQKQMRERRLKDARRWSSEALDAGETIVNPEDRW